jgi:pilus assembly protein Flp/PilA
MRALARAFSRLIRDRRGATAVEYGFILALVFLGMVAAVRGLSGQTQSMWNNVSTSVRTATGS